MSSPLRLIQVGLGFWGGDWAETILPGVASVQVVGWVDRDPKVRAAKQDALGLPAESCFASLNEALNAVEADAVVVTVPLSAHAAVTQEALDAGKHVLCEKPFTQTAIEAKALAERAAAADRVLMVAQNYRFFPAPIAVRDLIGNGRMGLVASLSVDFRSNANAIGYRYWDIPAPLLGDMAIHHFDLMRMVLGDDAVTVSCRSWNDTASEFTHDAAAAATIQFAGGAVASYRGSWLNHGAPTPWAGEWRIDGSNAEAWWTSRGRRPADPTRDDCVLLRREEGAPSSVPLTRLPHIDRAGCLAAFAEAVLEGAEPPAFSSARDNVLSLAISDAAIRSAAEKGRPVQIREVLTPT